MSQGHNINIGGDYIGSVEGVYVKGNYVNGNYIDNRTEGYSINLQRDFSQIAIDIQSLSVKLQAEGYYPADVQQKIADALVAEVKSNPSLGKRLIKLWEQLGSFVASGLVGEGAVEIVKFALRALGYPV